MRLIAVLSLLTALSFSTSATAQDVTPAGRVVVIDQGKSAVVTVQFDDGCKPTWTALSGNTAIATVKAGSAKGSAKRKFKIKAAKDIAPSMTTVTLSALGVGGGACAADQDVVITVVVVRSSKHAVSMAGKGAKTATKNYTKSRKDAEKQFKSSLEQILDDLETDLANIDVAAEAPSLPEQRAKAIRNSLTQTMLLYMLFLSNIITGYDAYAFNGRFAASQAIFNYGYLPFIATTLLIGGGGIWDAFLFKLISVGLGSGQRGAKLLTKHFKKLALIAAVAGVPMTYGLLNYSPFLCFPSVCGPSVPPLFLTQPDPVVSPLTARDFETLGNGQLALASGGDEGFIPPIVLAYKLQMLMLMPFIQYVSGVPQRYVLAGGLAPTSEGSVNTALVGDGDSDSGGGSIGPFGTWIALLGGSIGPSKYELSITGTDTGNTVQRFVDLSAH